MSIYTDGAISKDPNNSTNADINTPDIDGGTIDGATLAGNVYSDLDASKVVVTDGDKKLDSSNDITAFVAAATTDAAGKVELATDAETVTGSATDKATTPANITARLASPPAIGGTAPAAGTFTDLSGNIPPITDGETGNVTAAQMKGQTHIVTGAYTRSLPTAAVGYHAEFIASTAAVFSIDLVTETDVIVLNGTALTAGNKVSSDGSIYAACYVECPIAGKYVVYPIQGVFADGGA